MSTLAAKTLLAAVLPVASGLQGTGGWSRSGWSSWYRRCMPSEEYYQTDAIHLKVGKRVDVRATNDVLGALRASIDFKATEAERLTWRRRQKEMVDRTAALRNYGGADQLKSSALYDGTFWNFFSYAFRKDPNFFLGLVYIPLPWHFVVETAPRWAHDNTSLLMAYDFLGNLSRKVKYFTIMSQSHVGQIEDLVQRRSVRWDNILVFDTRGRDNRASTYPRVPIPLLRRYDVKVPPAVHKQPSVFFSGNCHFDESRMMMGPGKAVPPMTGNYTWNIHKCDDVMKSKDFQEHLANATWAITPAGSMPTSFQIYEALQYGSLVVLPYSCFNSSHWGPTETLNTPYVWLPYRNIGLQWQSNIAELLPQEELGSLQARIEGLPRETVEQRQAMLKRVMPLFRVEGLTIYIMYMVSLARQVSSLPEAFGPEFNRMGFVTRT